VTDTAPAVFSLFTTFLRTASLKYDAEAGNYPDYYTTLVQLFTFANNNHITPLRNTVIDTFLKLIASTPSELPYGIISSIYDATTHASSLRDLLVCVTVNIGAAADVRKNSASLPKEFLVDCLAVAGDERIVPFERGLDDEDVQVWLKGKMGSVCEEYHVHDYADSSDEHEHDGRDEHVEYRSRSRKKVSKQEAWERAGELVRRNRRDATVRSSAFRSMLRDIEEETNVLAERRGDQNDDEEWDESESESEDEDDEGIREMKRLFDEESEARMKYLLESLPPRERY